MIVDKDDYPDIILKYCTDVAGYSRMAFDKETTDSQAIVKLSSLMSIRKEDDWMFLENNISKLKKIVIEDDIELKNTELAEYKEFFLKTYYWRFKRCCKECYIKSR